MTIAQVATVAAQLDTVAEQLKPKHLRSSKADRTATSSG
jgi:hypothetical protein